MKTGILSMYGNENLGNRVQNYALQTVLKCYGNPVVTIKNDSFGNTKFDKIKKAVGQNEWHWLLKILGKNRKALFVFFPENILIQRQKCIGVIQIMKNF